MAEKISYTDAYNELKEIVEAMEQSNVSVDDLAKKIERAGLLIQICKDKLTKTEEEINKIVEKFE
ncbi:MAG: exodeoxyribonuclease VII small subunit [Bacteroidales bacterium]|nr:exodeoxyribonuclease VII small subunit [Bacteroidales bacterium]